MDLQWRPNKKIHGAIFTACETMCDYTPLMSYYAAKARIPLRQFHEGEGFPHICGWLETEMEKRVGSKEQEGREEREAATPLVEGRRPWVCERIGWSCWVLLCRICELSYQDVFYRSSIL